MRIPEHIRTISIGRIGLPPRLTAALMRGGVLAVGDLASTENRSLLDILGISSSDLSVIAKAVERFPISTALSVGTELPCVRITPMLQHRPLADLNLTRRAYNALRNHGMHTVGDLDGYSLRDFQAVRNFGVNSIAEVLSTLEACGCYGDDATPRPEGGSACQVQLAHYGLRIPLSVGDMSLDALSLSVRARNALHSNGFVYLGDFDGKSVASLRLLKNLGSLTVSEILGELRRQGAVEISISPFSYAVESSIVGEGSVSHSTDVASTPELPQIPSELMDWSPWNTLHLGSAHPLFRTFGASTLGELSARWSANLIGRDWAMLANAKSLIRIIEEISDLLHSGTLRIESGRAQPPLVLEDALHRRIAAAESVAGEVDALLSLEKPVHALFVRDRWTVWNGRARVFREVGAIRGVTLERARQIVSRAERRIAEQVVRLPRMSACVEVLRTSAGRWTLTAAVEALKSHDSSVSEALLRILPELARQDLIPRVTFDRDDIIQLERAGDAEALAAG